MWSLKMLHIGLEYYILQSSTTFPCLWPCVYMACKSLVGKANMYGILRQLITFSGVASSYVSMEPQNALGKTICLALLLYLGGYCIQLWNQLGTLLCFLAGGREVH